MCAPCKIILNNGGLTGTLAAIERAITHLNSRHQDLHPDTYAKLVKVICDAHQELQALEPLIYDGPFVPFEYKIVPIEPAPAATS